ncbi:MAG TPA: AAA family ATPase [Acidimicrobiales bacterium]|nr:AAA family ATPase [Acidimicrobiales bacterium]
MTDTARAQPSQVHTAYLLARVSLLEGRVAHLVELRRRSDPSPDDPFRGLYLADEHVGWLLSGRPSQVEGTAEDEDRQELEDAADRATAEGCEPRLRRLAWRAGLSELDVELLVAALAPDLDSRFEQLYGYLNDDVSRRRASVGLALTLCGEPAWSGQARARLRPDAPLAALGLLAVDEPDRPYLTRSLRVPDRVVSYLLGEDRPDPALAALLAPPSPAAGLDRAAALRRVLDGDPGLLVYLRQGARASATAILSALQADGLDVVHLDLGALSPSEDFGAVAVLARREALLSEAVLAAGPLEAVADRAPAMVRALASAVLSTDQAQPTPLVLYGRAAWEPALTRWVPLVMEVPPTATEERWAQWERSLEGVAAVDDPLAATDQFRLSVEEVHRSATAARLQAALAGSAVTGAHLRAGARAQNSAGLERLARRIEPEVGWDDLVVAPPTAEGLRELAVRARRRDAVLKGWKMRPGGGRGSGVSALFAGDPGTGKTMAAEVIAGELGVDLYVVSLATVVDKYVGETEKNLERIFSEADGVNGILLFDEADALFGKRSEVRDAHDRFANIEVAYLLQRMEAFDGLAILATNLRSNVDEAFARRLDLVVEFPMPDEALRAALWDQCLGPVAPRADDIDLTFCAEAFVISGGSIRSAAVTAAYLAMEEGRSIAMVDLVRAVQREYRKLGRLVVPAEFGRYHHLVSASG